MSVWYLSPVGYTMSPYNSSTTNRPTISTIRTMSVQCQPSCSIGRKRAKKKNAAVRRAGPSHDDVGGVARRGLVCREMTFRHCYWISIKARAVVAATPAARIFFSEQSAPEKREWLLRLQRLLSHALLQYVTWTGFHGHRPTNEPGKWSTVIRPTSSRLLLIIIILVLR